MLANNAARDERVALEEGRVKLLEDQAALATREDRWAAAQASVEQALTETREASGALRLELVNPVLAKRVSLG